MGKGSGEDAYSKATNTQDTKQTMRHPGGLGEASEGGRGPSVWRVPRGFVGLKTMLPDLSMTWHTQEGVTVVGSLGQGPNAAQAGASWPGGPPGAPPSWLPSAQGHEHFPAHQLGSPALRKEQNPHRWVASSKAQGRKVVSAGCVLSEARKPW